MTWATNVLHDQLAQNVPDCAIIPKWIKKAQFNGVFISVIIRTSFPNDEFIYFIRLARITLGSSVHLCLTVNWVPLHSDISHLFNSEVQLLRYIHQRAIFCHLSSRSPMLQDTVRVQPAQNTAREQTTLNVASNNTARSTLTFKHCPILW